MWSQNNVQIASFKRLLVNQYWTCHHELFLISFHSYHNLIIQDVSSNILNWWQLCTEFIKFIAGRGWGGVWICKGLKKKIFLQEKTFTHELASPFKAGSATEVETESRPHTASSSFPLLKVCFRCPYCSIVGHIVVSSEQLHFLPK